MFLLGVKHRQIIVRLRQLRIVFRKLGEHANGIGRLVHLGIDKSLQKATLGILGLVAQIGIHFFQCLRVLPLLDQTLYFRQVVGKSGGAKTDGQADRQCTQRLELLKTGLEQGNRGHRYAILFGVIQSNDSTKNVGDSIGIRKPAPP